MFWVCRPDLPDLVPRTESLGEETTTSLHTFWQWHFLIFIKCLDFHQVQVEAVRDKVLLSR
jgi:hypothetical protein